MKVYLLLSQPAQQIHIQQMHATTHETGVQQLDFLYQFACMTQTICRVQAIRSSEVQFFYC